MYPQRELTELALHKVALRRNIAVRRAQCVAAAARVARPLEWLDRALAFWRRLTPFVQFAALPLGLVIRRMIFSRFKFLGQLARWGLLAFGLVRGIRGRSRSAA